MIPETMPPSERTDADLVVASLTGRRDAFRQIVERYQTLICSIAYSATGNVSRSEDVAQETFIAAWSHLPSLREPAKLRGWLCGIVRHRIQRDRRDETREPVRQAASLDHVHDSPAPDALPSEQAVTRDEEAILWRSLERIPELYREPLVLFYREHRSIEHVAAALELSEDAVKQRLSRGRKLLQDEVQSFVENALRRTAPDRTFSTEVLSMLPLAVGPAAAAGAGLGAKSTAAAKSGALALVVAPLAPFFGIAAGIAAFWLVLRDTTADRRQRAQVMLVAVLVCLGYLALAAGGEIAVHRLAGHFAWGDRASFVAVVGYWSLFVAATLTVQVLVIRRVQAQRRSQAESDLTRPASSPALPLRALAMAVIGGHLGKFWWLIHLAWRHGDWVGTAATVAAMVLLGGWSFVRFRGLTGRAIRPLLSGHAALLGAAILAILNLRADVWAATYYGVTVEQVRHLLPLWLVPVLTLGLIGWTWLLLAVTRPRGGATAG